MQNLENLDVFDYTKTAQMPEGPFCQICAQLYQNTGQPMRYRESYMSAPLVADIADLT